MSPLARRVLIATLFMVATTWFPFPVQAAQSGIDSNPVEVRLDVPVEVRVATAR